MNQAEHCVLCGASIPEGRQLCPACDVNELNMYKQWVNDLQSGMYVNCVYCGHRYGPAEDTPVSMADVLKEHIEHCPKHPMSQLKSENERLSAENANLTVRYKQLSKAICGDENATIDELLSELQQMRHLPRLLSKSECEAWIQCEGTVLWIEINPKYTHYPNQPCEMFIVEKNDSAFSMFNYGDGWRAWLKYEPNLQERKAVEWISTENGGTSDD